MKLIVAITGATGSIYGIRLLEVLRGTPDVETHLIISGPAGKTILHETDWKIEDVMALADVVYDVDDIGAAISSGSFRTSGMIIAPCSVKTMSAIANSYNTNLIIRAADVVLKERRRLVLCMRETPLHRGHIRQMLSVTEMGAILLPPFPAFYNKPKTVEQIVDHTVGRMLDLFNVEHKLFKRWHGLS